MLVGAFVASCLLLTVRAEDVLELTTDNFEDHVFASGKNSLVKFYAPWCGHCKRLAPTWEELATEYKEDTSVNIAHLDCTAHQSLCTKYGVSGYPTLKYFKNGDTEGADYKSGRDLGSLKTFVDDELASGCLIANIDDCSEKEQKYFKKWNEKGAESMKAELERLQGMTGKSMKAELKKWLFSRINLLKQSVEA